MRTRPDILREIRLPSGRVNVDEHGYLTDPFLWSPDFAHHAAAQEQITLTDAHFALIAFIRDWRDEHGVSPDFRHALRHLGHGAGLSKSAAKDVFFTLFPGGYVKQACKVAGMKQPRAWSTG